MVQTYQNRPRQRWRCCCTAGSWCFFFVNRPEQEGYHFASLVHNWIATKMRQQNISLLNYSQFVCVCCAGLIHFSISYLHTTASSMLSSLSIATVRAVPVNSFSFVKSQSLCAMDFTLVLPIELRNLHDQVRTVPEKKTQQRTVTPCLLTALTTQFLVHAPNSFTRTFLFNFIFRIKCL